MKYFPLRSQQHYSKNWWLQLLWGCALVIMGLFLLLNPLVGIIGLLALLVLAGPISIIIGVFLLVSALRIKQVAPPET